MIAILADGGVEQIQQKNLVLKVLIMHIRTMHEFSIDLPW